ncbi:hypothetical protein GGI07_004803 [Coemansia sp. Benny D115]|nr:hypothetical protein GGI07_004803 [Coemansia sp. Benny D115]
MKLTSAFAVLATAFATASAQSSIGPTFGQDLCCATNVERAKAGLPALKWSPRLDNSSQGHCNWMVAHKTMNHFETAGTSTYGLAQRLDVSGFDFGTAGENLGQNYQTVADVTTGWMNSPLHKANILGRDFTVCGGAIGNPGGFIAINYASPFDSSDSAGFYTLKCSGQKSQGAYLGNAAPAPVATTPSPVGHNAATTSKAPVVVVRPVGTASAVQPAPSPSATKVPIGHNAGSPGTKVVVTTPAPPPPPASDSEDESSSDSSSPTHITPADVARAATQSLHIAHTIAHSHTPAQKPFGSAGPAVPRMVAHLWQLGTACPDAAIVPSSDADRIRLLQFLHLWTVTIVAAAHSPGDTHGRARGLATLSSHIAQQRRRPAKLRGPFWSGRAPGVAEIAAAPLADTLLHSGLVPDEPQFAALATWLAAIRAHPALNPTVKQSLGP